MVLAFNKITTKIFFFPCECQLKKYDVIIIGAGPAGCSCANLLALNGKSVLVIEKSTFPRFTLGESLLAQSISFFEEAGLEEVFNQYEFKFKNGALFLRGDEYKAIEFQDMHLKGEKFTTFQVRRDVFDHEIVKICEKNGVEFLFNTSVLDIVDTEDQSLVKVEKDSNIESYLCNFIGDASGFARVLSKIKGHTVHHIKNFRVSAFNHIVTKEELKFDNNKILITIDDKIVGKWFWLIPLGENRYSIGVTVNNNDLPADYNKKLLLVNSINDNPFFKNLLSDFEFVFNHQAIENYTTSSEVMYGDKFVLIGNSKEFIDPVFSSGVTVGLKSGVTASKLILKKLNGETVDWDAEYLKPQNKAIEIFRAFIDSWYEGKLQHIFYSTSVDKQIYSMMVSVLAGYVWDETNIFHQKNPKKLLDSIYEYTI